MRVAAVQCRVDMDIKSNLRSLDALTAGLPAQTVVVAPEGLLSGYLPSPGLTNLLDEDATAAALDHAGRLAARAKLHLIAGACICVNGLWRNASVYFGPDGRRFQYDKVNLAISERGDFVAGDKLSVFKIVVDGQPLSLAVQMCREIRYPEQWRWLAMQGAQVIAYVNNAVGSQDGHDLWRAHVISRAAETQRFIVGANNAARDQTCPSLIVSPKGRVIDEASVGSSTVISAEIDISEVTNWVIEQARADLVSVQPPVR